MYTLFLVCDHGSQILAKHKNLEFIHGFRKCYQKHVDYEEDCTFAILDEKLKRVR